MILIYGGKYQGKLDFIKEKFSIDDRNIIDLCDYYKNKIVKLEDINFDNKICINNINYLYEILYNDNIDIIDFTNNKLLPIIKNKNVYVIAIDESCGIVPLDEGRLYRENVSKAINNISKASKEVYRVFVGIGIKIK